jgi:hypothetical protein
VVHDAHCLRPDGGWKLRIDGRSLWAGPRTLSDGSLTYAAISVTPNA